MMFRTLFQATKLQVATYLLGVALFSISFLVFLNASVSFVITDLIGQKKGVGDAVGTLGFADELVVLVACPLWGLLSDKLGVRTVVVVGYGIVGLSLFVFVQARNVYPQLLLARLFFSIGAAATSTMVTAILPAMTIPRATRSNGGTRSHVPSMSSEAGQTPAGYFAAYAQDDHAAPPSSRSTSQIAGLVGMFTGCGALLALGAFLPLPARLQDQGYTPANAIIDSFYLVGAIALAVALSCSLGLGGLAGEEDKGLINIVKRFRSSKLEPGRMPPRSASLPRLLLEALKLGFTDVDVALGYLGGFVARASSVGISLFIPLYVNAYFVSTGLCKDNPHSDPTDIKEKCRDAYKIAAILSGVSQLVALICAPLFGYLDSRFHRLNAPLLTAAAAGILGYILLARLPSPEPSGERGSPAIFVIMALLGVSQIGAIVCSLSALGRGIQGSSDTGSNNNNRVPARQRDSGTHEAGESQETSPLMSSHPQGSERPSVSRNHLKGSVAGVYSLAGGAGILLLTKLGGALFDSLSPGAPFYMLAIFNACLLIAGVACGVVQGVFGARRHSAA